MDLAIAGGFELGEEMKLCGLDNVTQGCVWSRGPKRET